MSTLTPGAIMDAICSAKSNEDAAALGSLYVKLPRARAPLNENGAATEVDSAVSIESAGSIRVSDTAKDSALVSPEQAQRHSLEAVGVGITRFLDAFRASFGTDAAPELDVPVLCIECGQYPAAWMQRCFSCQASRRVPTC